MKHNTIGVSAAAGALALILNTAATAAVTFETVELPIEGYWNGSDLTGTPGPAGDPYGEIPYSQDKQIEGVGFHNTFTDWGFGSTSWTGFAVSNHTNVTTAGFGNQYSAYAGGGAAGSSQYGIGFYSSWDTSTVVSLGGTVNLAGLGASFTNTTYAALDMINGTPFVSKAFGGATGDDADWFQLTIEGFASGNSTGTVDFYLADYRFANNDQDYIVDEWTYVDFSALGSVDELRFSLTSSDVGDWGMNTPAYFAMDNFLAIPEPSTALVALSGLALLARRKR